MKNQSFDLLVETDWLAQNLYRDDIKTVDATWYMPGFPEKAYDQFLNNRIPGAVFFDIDAISDKSIDLPHMLPTEEFFANSVGSMGIKNDDHIVIYDQLGIFSSPRAWWTFRTMGHEKVSVLNGGLKKWQTDSLPIQKGSIEKVLHQQYSPKKQSSMVTDFNRLLESINNGKNISILDARPQDRFTGLIEEPRPGLKKGHMPGSKNLFFGDLINDNGTLKSGNQILQILKDKNITDHQPVITTCGSGITASILFFVLSILGFQNLSVYDGSWAEWGQRPNAPIKTG